MPSSRDKRTSATRHSLPLAATAAANNGPSHRPRLSTSAKAASAPTVSRGHGRTRSFLTGLLDRSNSSGSKRASLQPPAHRPSHSSSTKASPSPTMGEAGLRAPGAQKKRLSAPADFKGKASVSLPLNLSPTVVGACTPASLSSRPLKLTKSR
ncbi:hypothetical protein DMC30DRAFT_389731 [Rhodotorula diobovata]|uniref:Uncharacterized protein n=1 Tax=Rhodotorula diobovata TaxID=5288 RepID=A0A5C5G329_9BASI|nr:hypothetical protein DMC30DRAFT_389731 [Rhodotorula diobovata]